MSFWLILSTAALTTGALYFLSTGLEGIRPLVWIAPIPVLAVAPRTDGLPGAAVAFIAYLLGGFNLSGYLAKLAPLGVVVASLILPSIAFALAVLAYRFAALRLQHPVSFAMFPLAWTSYEYLLSIGSPHGTAGSLAYTQADFLPLIQIASLTGIWGITFVLTLVPAALAAAWHFRGSKKDVLGMLLVALIVGGACIDFGLVRLRRPTPGQSIRVGMAGIDSSADYFRTTDRTVALSIIEASTRLVGRLGAQGAKIVVLPEKLVGVTNEYEGEVRARLAEAARRNQLMVVAGLNLLGPAHQRNLALIFGFDGKLLAEYDKAFFIPGLEDGYDRGTTPVEFSLAGVSAGVAICKDLDFPNWIRNYGRPGIGVLLVPAWDFTQDAWLHSRMAVMRAVENGFALARSARQGLLTVCDHRGRVVGELSSSSAAEVVLAGEVPVGPGRTFYSVAGDWFAWACLLGLVVLLASAFLAGARGTRRGT